MPFNVAGAYSLPLGSIVADGTTIDAADHNTPIQDIEAALSQTVLRSGATPIVGTQAISVASLSAGSASAPSIIPTGDSNTGFWFPAADTIAASTGGTERLRVDSSGNVGVGSTPNASQGRLQVFNTAITGGSPSNSGTTDSNQIAQFRAGSVQLRFGVLGAGDYWIQPSSGDNYATNYGLQLCPNGGNVLVTGSGGLGYGTGSGGTVTQLTSKATGVTLNKTNGKITMNSAALASGTNVQFVFTNSTIAATDIVVITPNFSGTVYQAWVYETVAGACAINVVQNSGGSRSDAVVLNFAVIKAATS